MFIYAEDKKNYWLTVGGILIACLVPLLSDKTKTITRTVKKLINPNTEEIVQFMQSSHFSDPAALQLYALATACNHTSLTTLWFAILGLTEHFLLEHIDNVRYETVFNALQNEASRLTDGKELFVTIPIEDGEVVTPVNSITVPVSRDLFIQPCVDLRCNLMRHWTLFDSMQSSPFVASRLRLWYNAGMEMLNLLLVKMGIPLREAKTTYISMSSDIREHLVRRFDQWCDKFGLSGIAFFSLSRIKVSKSFIVHSPFRCCCTSCRYDSDSPSFRVTGNDHR